MRKVFSYILRHNKYISNSLGEYSDRHVDKIVGKFQRHQAIVLEQLIKSNDGKGSVNNVATLDRIDNERLYGIDGVAANGVGASKGNSGEIDLFISNESLYSGGGVNHPENKNYNNGNGNSNDTKVDTTKSGPEIVDMREAGEKLNETTWVPLRLTLTTRLVHRLRHFAFRGYLVQLEKEGESNYSNSARQVDGGQQ